MIQRGCELSQQSAIIQLAFRLPLYHRDDTAVPMIQPDFCPGVPGGLGWSRVSPADDPGVRLAFIERRPFWPALVTIDQTHVIDAEKV